MDMSQRRAELVAAALDLFVERGVQHTSIRDITGRVGVTRSLFYHYFDDKDAIVDAVIDDRVSCFLRNFKEWNQAFDVNNVAASVQGIVPIIRAFLTDPSSFGQFVVGERNALLRQKFTVCCAKRLATLFSDVYPRELPAKKPDLPHPREQFYMLVIGLMSLVFEAPDTSDEVLLEIIFDTLHLEFQPTWVIA